MKRLQLFLLAQMIVVDHHIHGVHEEIIEQRLDIWRQIRVFHIVSFLMIQRMLEQLMLDQAPRALLVHLIVSVLCDIAVSLAAHHRVHHIERMHEISIIVRQLRLHDALNVQRRQRRDEEHLAFIRIVAEPRAIKEAHSAVDVCVVVVFELHDNRILLIQIEHRFVIGRRRSRHIEVALDLLEHERRLHAVVKSRHVAKQSACSKHLHCFTQ
mmetsp:Transcript_73757/g.117591  ORF Transcript_73757/g.117591 Transcript_73757/m.117591 type:complete len:212 (-) Transcript_73757:799-1434(-)